MTRLFALIALALGSGGVSVSGVAAQETHIPRLPVELLDVAAPSDRVEGEPVRMVTRPMECRSVPVDGVRRRIVDIAVQEWGFFGFPIMDEVEDRRLLPPGMERDGGLAAFQPDSLSRRIWRRSPGPLEAGRVAASIAGYWAVTAEGAGIVRRQNDAWAGEDGITSRWVDPWSAAFISWVMCEAGLGTPSRFQRSIAHRVYIDQAIRARDGGGSEAAYVAYDLGEEPLEPGDLLCASSRPAYRNLSERRSQIGVGARTHCDIVVKVDDRENRVYAIGGNVMRSVSLKIFAAVSDGAVGLRPVVPNPGRPLFAHLKLRAAPVELDAMDRSPTIQALTCADAFSGTARLALVGSVIGVLSRAGAGGMHATGDAEIPSLSVFDEASESGCRSV